MKFAYLLKRLLVFFPVLACSSLVGFLISKTNDSEVVILKISEMEYQAKSILAQEREQKKLAAHFGINKPVFYFSLTTQACPDTFHRLQPKFVQTTAKHLLHQHGSWVAVSDYLHAIHQLRHAAETLPDSLKRGEWWSVLHQLPQKTTDVDIVSNLNILKNYFTYNIKNENFTNKLFQIEKKYILLKNNNKHIQLYLPKIVWHGTNNQYHLWLSHFLKGDFGQSSIDGLPIRQKLAQATNITIIVNIFAFLFAFALAVPMGVWAAAKQKTRFDRVSLALFFWLYAIPNFWVATLLVTFFTTDYYASWLNLFPASDFVGQFDDDSNSSWQRLIASAHYLVLPIFCVAYPWLAYIFTQTRTAMMQVLQADYIKTAYAKGLSKHKVLWQHAFKNAVFPLVSLGGAIIPLLLSGSVAVEYIFDLQGLGVLLIESVEARDYKLVFALIFFASFASLLGSLLADLLYTRLDPRVHFR